MKKQRPNNTSKSKQRKPPSKFTVKPGDVVSVVFKSYDPIKKEAVAKEVTAYVKNKTRMVYLQIFESPVPLVDNLVLIQIRRLYINPSNVIATKEHESKLKFKTEYEFVKFIKEDENEYKRAIENGRQ